MFSPSSLFLLWPIFILQQPTELIKIETLPQFCVEILPQRSACVSGPIHTFLLDKHEVTWSEYLECVRRKGCAPINQEWENLYKSPKKPVTGVTWKRAVAYCRWRGQRLPTLLEWKSAAIGKEGRTFPWGDEEPTLERAGTVNLDCSADCYREICQRPAGNTPDGICDMADNAMEWVQGLYDPFSRKIYADDVGISPRRINVDVFRLAAGGKAYLSPENKDQLMNTKALSHIVVMREEQSHYKGIGFRCAADLLDKQRSTTGSSGGASTKGPKN
jgi:formylglycine-generating enzyme required for sulfatase activity